MWKPIVFIIATALLVYVSRESLLRPRSHGFYRFLAWELMLGLFLLNAQAWIQNWLAWHQIISWLLLIASVVPLVLGITALRARGKPDSTERPEPQLLAFERTTQLVTDGIYKYIRHPLYSSLFILNWGIFFKRPSLAGMLLSLGASAFLIATAKADEAECMQVFGADYRQYRNHTRMFIPYVF
jgi:protein-S-isoprenylcysteine O-methyltransferase Ste14